MPNTFPFNTIKLCKPNLTKIVLQNIIISYKKIELEYELYMLDQHSSYFFKITFIEKRIYQFNYIPYKNL